MLNNSNHITSIYLVMVRTREANFHGREEQELEQAKLKLRHFLKYIYKGKQKE